MKTRYGWALASAMLLGGIGSAYAADMAVKAPPMAPAPVAMWTGPYIGLNAGWEGISRSGMTSAPNDPATVAFNAFCIAAGACPQNYGAARGSGFIGGGQIGYNWQMQNIVLGLETDFQGTRAKASTTAALTVAPFPPYVGTQSTRENWLGTVRGRIGLLVTPNLLGYATGGFAYSSVNRNWTGAFPTFGSAWGGGATSVVTGWTVGTGLEWAVGKGFSLGVEYLYVRLGGGSNFLTAPTSALCIPGGVPSCQFAIHGSSFDDNILRVKLNYSFGGPVARN